MKIGLLGLGVVGSGVQKIIDKMGNDDLQIKRILVRTERNDERITLNYEDILNDDEIDTVVECMGGLEPAHTYVEQALKMGKNVISANKKMLANYYEELIGIAEDNGVRILFEASTCGGIPWMANVRRIKRMEPIRSFRGIMNGTTNYILSNMTEFGLDFLEMLDKAQDLGYAEADPTDDIDGYDVRYKCIMSIINCFNKIVDEEDIPTYGIRTISKQDIAWGLDNYYTVKLIGTGVEKNNKLQAYVMPKFISNNDLFTKVGQNFNAIESVSDSLGAYIEVGQGAGQMPTGHAVVQDILTLYYDEEKVNTSLVKAEVDNSEVIAQFYIRSSEIDETNAIIQEKVGECAYITEEIRLDDLKGLELGSNSFVAMIEK